MTTTTNDHKINCKYKNIYIFDKQIVTILSLSSFFIYFPGRPCISTTTTTIPRKTNQPTNHTTTYYRFSPSVRPVTCVELGGWACVCGLLQVGAEAVRLGLAVVLGLEA